VVDGESEGRQFIENIHLVDYGGVDLPLSIIAANARFATSPPLAIVSDYEGITYTNVIECGLELWGAYLYPCLMLCSVNTLFRLIPSSWRSVLVKRTHPNVSNSSTSHDLSPNKCQVGFNDLHR
jgi:hypothetical protein